MRFCQQLYQNIKLENRITRAPLLYVALRYQQRKFNFMYFLFNSYFPLLAKVCAVVLCWAAGIWNGRPIRSNVHKRQKLFYCCEANTEQGYTQLGMARIKGKMYINERVLGTHFWEFIRAGLQKVFGIVMWGNE